MDRKIEKLRLRRITDRNSCSVGFAGSPKSRKDSAVFRYRVTLCGIVPISIHAPHAGCDDTFPPTGTTLVVLFQSTHPMRGATELDDNGAVKIPFQSTHPMRGATLNLSTTAFGTLAISIHAPHAGCDLDGNQS